MSFPLFKLHGWGKRFAVQPKPNCSEVPKKNHPTWHGWNFPGGHVEKGEYVTPSVIREMKEETGLTIL